MSKPARRAEVSRPKRLPETSPSGIGFVDIRTDQRFRWKRTVVHDGSLSSTARLIATLLADEYAGPNSEGIFPTQQTIADAIGVKVDTVQRALKQLDDAGYILRETEQVLREKRRTSYRLMWKADAGAQRASASSDTANLRHANPAIDPGATPQKCGIEPYSEPYPAPKEQGDMLEYTSKVDEQPYNRGAPEARPDEAFIRSLDTDLRETFDAMTEGQRQIFHGLPNDDVRLRHLQSLAECPF